MSDVNISRIVFEAPIYDDAVHPTVCIGYSLKPVIVNGSHDPTVASSVVVEIISTGRQHWCMFSSVQLPCLV